VDDSVGLEEARQRQEHNEDVIRREMMCSFSEILLELCVRCKDIPVYTSSIAMPAKRLAAATQTLSHLHVAAVLETCTTWLHAGVPFLQAAVGAVRSCRDHTCTLIVFAVLRPTSAFGATFVLHVIVVENSNKETIAVSNWNGSTVFSWLQFSQNGWRLSWTLLFHIPLTTICPIELECLTSDQHGFKELTIALV